MMRMRFIALVCLLGLGGLACSKDEPDQEEVTTGDENTAEEVGQDIDEAADETTDEIGHVGNDRDETVDEAQDKVDEATGAD